MQSPIDEVLCPLCHGHGRDRKERLVVRWRSREFEQHSVPAGDSTLFLKRNPRTATNPINVVMQKIGACLASG